MHLHHDDAWADIAADRAAAPAQPAGLLGKLMAAVRPQFRVDVLVPDPQDPIFGGPLCVISGCRRTGRARGLCIGHHRRWSDEGRPDLPRFVAATDPRLRGHAPLQPCRARGCQYGRSLGGLCKRHDRTWRKAGRPDVELWLATQPSIDPPDLPATCRISYCDLWVQGSQASLCASHQARWRELGRADIEEFLRGVEDDSVPGHECIDLRGLGRQLRLEVQYTLQRRREEGEVKARPGMVQQVVNFLASTGLTSLLDWPEHTWRQRFSSRDPKLGTSQWALVFFGLRQIEDLAYGRGWQVEYPRDLWRLRNLGIHEGSSTHVRFDRIRQLWLKELTKRWVRWRLSTGIGGAQATRCARAITRFSAFLAAPTVGIDDIAHIDRAVLERYLAELHTELAGRRVHGDHIGLLGNFFTAIRQHGWNERLPANAMFHAEDYPQRGQALPRALAEHVMTQLERPGALHLWDDPARCLITVILMRCGLRLGDARRLRHDCITHDGDGAPYLRYFNHKMKREALVPIDEELEQLIRQQQRRVLDRWPQPPVLFPRPTANPDGHKPISDGTYRDGLSRWMKRCDVRDEHGHPIRLTPHQWRHTLGTRLINKDVPQEVVRKILDHDSHAMTAHYARLHDTTVRRHWEQARKVNISGDTVTLDPNGPVAEAAWAKQRLSRATQALPNGYCGLPLVQSCPHANSCLTCPMFLTTNDFLPQHRQHRQQTLQIITAAEGRGQTRMAEMNRQVADNLEKIITALEADEDQQQVADAS